ncbi:MAG: 30S ribosomal protein S16 [Acidimicrobiales bacterium]
MKLRLMRMGKKKQPTYRVVAADTRSPRDGRFIEIIGTYQPRHDPSSIAIDNDRAVHWLRHGAKPTERVEKLLKISGAWESFTGQSFDATPPPPKVTVAADSQPAPAAADQAPAAPAEEAPAEDAPAEEAAAPETVSEEAPAEEAAAEEAPAEEAPAPEPVAEDAPADDTSADETTAEGETS